eukprot:CAMPEP_0171071276 /NCGR_PEP_ID=MMETSP0766_2-20121228/10233_1 /TAXON_ID=439317 /ORGANISM="Gambierdiscus australes, Strain CAWD 149" /LENGTH=491 /DNA_ID=CAMNT_0011527809 /DNA_START=37 /DNA_END=1512 /DNA_ORIENTATION=-
MPVFEQKLVSPLAVRFTQEHIRTTFRDGQRLEDSIRQIKAVPGTGEYHLILEAPFPNIEIIRWRTPCHGQAGTASRGRSEADLRLGSSGEERTDAEHWFTLDNRRLYCLQLAAMEHWPSRVAVVVDLLYADAGRIWKKYDSSTCGRSVTIGHSTKGPSISRWDWYVMAQQEPSHSDVALQAVGADDGKTTVEALQDAPEEPGLIAALARGEQPLERVRKGGGCPTPSTADGSEDSDAAETGSSRAVPAAEEFLLSALRKGLAGTWKGSDGETYRFDLEEQRWLCLPCGASCSEPFLVSYDAESTSLWLSRGGGSAFFLSAAAIAREPEELTIYAVADPQMQGPGHIWRKQGSTGTGSGVDTTAAQSSAVAPSVPGAEATPTTAEPNHATEAAAEVIAEVEAQLRAPSNHGFVWVDDWHRRYQRYLGSLRTFLESRPDLFVVHPGRGRGYTVSLAARVASEPATKTAAAKRKPARGGIAPARKWVQCRSGGA